MAISKIKTGSITDSAITSAKISDGTIVNADISPSAAIASCKTVICTAVTDQNAFNISLLGFKMAVNEGLTVFNLVDGIVDEFHDESGTDEAEGSNDLYVADSDYYINSTQPTGVPSCGPISAGFTTTAVTEPDTSTAATNPSYHTGTLGSFTVPAGMTTANIFVWGGAGGGGGFGTSPYSPRTGGSGGFAEGALATTPGQVLRIVAGVGGGSRSCNSESAGAFFGGGAISMDGNSAPGQASGLGGGLAGVLTTNSSTPTCHSAPGVYIIAGSGGGACNDTFGGAGGGLTGCAGASTNEQTNKELSPASGGGGGSQTAGGQGNKGDNTFSDFTGAFLKGGLAETGGSNAVGSLASGGAGYYGGGGGARNTPEGPNGDFAGGGGSSYYGHPQITSGSTEEGQSGSEPAASGGSSSPHYPVTSTAGQGNGSAEAGNPGFVLITGCKSAPATTTSTTIISTAFSATSVPTTSRIVVFQENVATPTLNTDIIASISRDGGSNFTTATLSDSGYVTGASGQRILTGQATISGQPSGQSMRWKLALANNAVKIHGVSLQWA